jgi:hypothetical protein
MVLINAKFKLNESLCTAILPAQGGRQKCVDAIGMKRHVVAARSVWLAVRLSSTTHDRPSHPAFSEGSPECDKNSLFPGKSIGRFALCVNKKIPQDMQ